MPSRVVLTTIASPDYFSIQLALYYLKAYFLKHKNPHFPTLKIDIKILIFKSQEKWDDIAKNIISERPEIVGFSCYVWNIKKILLVAKEIKKADPAVKIILGGSEVSPRAESILKHEGCVDIVVRGEGEETFLELLESLLYQQGELSLIKGMSYRQGGKIFVNPARPQIDDLDKIPSPYLAGLIDLKCEDKSVSAVTETMRGCHYRCHFCYYHKEFNRIKYFSLSRVEKELKWILKREPEKVYLMDPTFNVDCERAKKILRIFIKHNKSSRLHLELRAEKIDAEMVGLLKQAGVAKLEIWIQSVSRESLKLVNRDLDRNICAKNIRLLNKGKIFFEIQLIDALPGHTYETIKEGVDWLISLRVPRIVIMELLVLPGTCLRENSEALGVRYKPEPNYSWVRTHTLSTDDRNKIIRLRQALEILYNAGFLRHALFVLKRGLGINFTDILQAWMDRDSQLGAAEKKRKDAFIGFIKYLYNKYKNTQVNKKARRVFLQKDFQIEDFLRPGSNRKLYRKD